jgi:hypothetical protein
MMAKKKINDEIDDEIEEEIDEFYDVDETDDELDVATTVSRFMAGFGAEDGETEIKIFRKGKGAKRSFLFAIDTEDMQGIEDRLRDEYDGGHFEARLWNITKGRILKRIPVDVEAPKRPNPAMQPQQNNSANMAEMFERMTAASDDKMMRMMEMAELRSKNMMLEMAQLLKPAEQKSGVEETLQLMQLMQSFQPKQESALDLIKEMNKTKEAINDFHGEEPQDMMGVLSKGADTLMTMVKENQAKKPAVPHTNPAPRVQARPQPKEETDMGLKETVINRGLRQYVAPLIQLAIENKDVEPYAPVILDRIPEEHHDTLWSIVGAGVDPSFERLAQIEPAVREHETWFRLLLDELHELLRPATADELAEEAAEAEMIAEAALIKESNEEAAKLAEMETAVVTNVTIDTDNQGVAPGGKLDTHLTAVENDAINSETQPD